MEISFLLPLTFFFKVSTCHASQNPPRQEKERFVFFTRRPRPLDTHCRTAPTTRCVQPPRNVGSTSPMHPPAVRASLEGHRAPRALPFSQGHRAPRALRFCDLVSFDGSRLLDFFAKRKPGVHGALGAYLPPPSLRKLPPTQRTERQPTAATLQVARTSILASQSHTHCTPNPLSCVLLADSSGT